MGAVLWVDADLAATYIIMNKAIYAAAFLGLCAVVLLVHTQVNPGEETDMAQESVPQDPFLANLEAHVIAKAQRRLKQRARANKRKKHINNARAAMKTMLLNAANDAQRGVRQMEKEEAKKRLAAKAKNAKGGGGKKADAKQFTWAQLQKGEDKAKENFANQKMGTLLSKLKQAPKADKKKHLQDAQKATDQKSTAMAKALADAKANAKKNLKKDDDDDDDDFD